MRQMYMDKEKGKLRNRFLSTPSLLCLFVIFFNLLLYPVVTNTQQKAYALQSPASPYFNSNTSIYADTIYCSVPSSCVVGTTPDVAGEPDLFFTANGGQSFNQYSLSPNPITAISAINCPTSVMCFIGSVSPAGSSLFKTTDFGTNVDSLATIAGSITQIACVSVNQCFFISNDSQNYSLYTFTGSGQISGPFISAPYLGSLNCTQLSLCYVAELSSGHPSVIQFFASTPSDPFPAINNLQLNGLTTSVSVSCPEYGQCAILLTGSQNVLLVTADNFETFSSLNLPNYETSHVSCSSIQRCLITAYSGNSLSDFLVIENNSIANQLSQTGLYVNSTCDELGNCYALGANANNQALVLYLNPFTSAPSSNGFLDKIAGTQIAAPLRLAGTNLLLAPLTILFGSVSASSINVISNTFALVTPPLNLVGYQSVTVSNIYGSSQIGYVYFSPPSGYVGLKDPIRICDTRTGSMSPCQGQSLSPGNIFNLYMHNNEVLPDSNVSAVVLNVTATNVSANSNLIIFPYGNNPPTTSNISLSANNTIASLSIVAVTPSSIVSFLDTDSSLDLIVDLVGYFDPNSNNYYNAISPVRICDTRTSISPACVGGPVLSGQSLSISLSNLAQYIPTTASAALINVTVIGSGVGYVSEDSAYYSSAPNSTINYYGSIPIANLTFASINPYGGFYLNNFGGTAEIVVDLIGYFDSSGGSSFSAISPFRLCNYLDSNSNCLSVSGAGGTQASTLGSQVSCLNQSNCNLVGSLTVTSSQTGYMALYTGTFNGTSNINFQMNQSIANLVNIPTTVQEYSSTGPILSDLDVIGGFTN